jgi:tRNA pseudouridine38-40 synthase
MRVQPPDQFTGKTVVSGYHTTSDLPPLRRADYRLPTVSCISMNRYFLEVAYRGSRYAGSQVQANAVTVQYELERAMKVYFRQEVSLTGSSRTDAGVHALQNYFHFDMEGVVHPQSIYNLNAILPGDIAVRSVRPVGGEAHCRFDALSRSYEYIVYQEKDPFLEERAYYFPYTLQMETLQAVAGVIGEYEDFTSFSKRNSQVKTFNCRIIASAWSREGTRWVYRVRANRFLRGMVRGLVGTMLQVGRGKMDISGFRGVIEAKNCARADFSVPGHGLYLLEVEYGEGYFG